MLVYHCSNMKIEKFNFVEGVHFGGIRSALEAGLRKEPNGTLFLHRCKLHPSSCELVVEDLAHKEAWNVQAKDMLQRGWRYAKYRNKYEPDSFPSYFVVSESIITILGVEYIDSADAEEFVCEEYYKKENADE